MPTVPLPHDPNLDQLRNQARELQRAARRGDAAAQALITEFHPTPPDIARLRLSAAQLVLARRYGFPSWARLRRHVDIVTARSWSPDGPAADESLPDRFLRLACLTYDEESVANRQAAATLLAEHPELSATDFFVAAACADATRVAQFLAQDRAWARATGGPYGWSPLLYLAYARHDPAVGRTATLDTARMLLEAGADPDDGRFWRGLPTPFTVLTGVFGAGEQDQPRHPHSIPLARLLLEAGAESNDGQTLYNRMFGTDDDHLELLFEFGLGTGDGGPWRRLLGDALESPATMLRNLLWWAVSHDQRERVALLSAHGVDIRSAFHEVRYRPGNGHTPVEVALLNGHIELADQLRTAGGGAPELDPVETFVASVLAGDGALVRRTDAATISAARRTRPGLLVWAAAQGAPEAVDLLVEAGFDVDSFGRSDAPIDAPWHTALHVAAQQGDVSLAQRLLTLGASRDLHDKQFDGTPLDWARYFDQQAVIDLLTPVADEGD